jgi:dUTP pyrophosphatase
MSLPVIKFVKMSDDAVVPTKGTPYSVGYDLTLIREVKRMSPMVTLYGTGIKVQPPEGYYTEIVPRSSISKTGYMLANSVGTIDPDYTGELLVALRKCENGPELQLPCIMAQLVLHRAEHYTLEQVDVLDETVRGEGGFGSTSA